MSVRNYAILWPDRKSVSSTAGGGNQLLSTGAHELDGPEHTGDLPETRLSTTETDTDLRLAPDGIGGVEWAATAAGFDVPFDHGAMGTTETVDIADGMWHRGTLNDDCTITVQGFTADEALVVVVEVIQNATGGFGITWDSDVDFGTVDDQPDLTALATTYYLLFTSAGDTAIRGAKVGGGGSSVAALDDLSDVTIAAVAEGDTLRRIGSAWVNDNRRWEPVTTNPGTGPEIVWDGDDIVMTWRAY